jgi:hypothetical protein
MVKLFSENRASAKASDLRCPTPSRTRYRQPTSGSSCCPQVAVTTPRPTGDFDRLREARGSFRASSGIILRRRIESDRPRWPHCVTDRGEPNEVLLATRWARFFLEPLHLPFTEHQSRPRLELRDYGRLITNQKETEMKVFVLTMAILAGVASPISQASARPQFCTTQCMAGMCTTICN